jgi:DNA invertase Pin-like site-specific DNA recombinase
MSRPPRGVVVAEFEEVESGKKNDRPQIAAALAACRLRRATLVIAKLDRLARNVHFISNLMNRASILSPATIPMRPD